MEEKPGVFCGPTSTHYYHAAQQFPKTIYIFACVINVLTSVSSTLGNIMILFALRKCHLLHSPSKALLCGFTLTDLVVGLCVLPLFTSYYLTIILEIILPTYYCAIAMTCGRISSFVGSASLATIVTIALDRFLAFYLRLRYKDIVKFGRVVCILVLEWILAATWSGCWFWSAKFNLIWGSMALPNFCLITSFSYLSIYRVSAITSHKFINKLISANLTTSMCFNTRKLCITCCGSSGFCLSVTLLTYRHNWLYLSLYSIARLAFHCILVLLLIILFLF